MALSIYADELPPTTVSACVNDSSGEVKIVDADEDCKKKETKISWPLDVGGVVTVEGTVQVEGAVEVEGKVEAGDGFKAGAASTNYLDGAITNTGATANLDILSGNLFIDDTNNRVGIGTTSPVTDLQVVGGIKAGSVETSVGMTAQIGTNVTAYGLGSINLNDGLDFNINGTMFIDNPTGTANDRVGIGTSSPLAQLHVQGKTILIGNVGIISRLGVGTSTPGTNLDVRGNIAVTGTVDGVDIAARDALHHTAPTALPPSGAAGGDLSGTYPEPTIRANAVALGTDTTGNYVATIAGNTQVGVSGSGSETAAVSLSIGANSLDAGHIAANAVDTSELASTAIAPGGTFGSATEVATFTVDADGRLIAASNVAISGVSATDNTKVLKAGDTMTGQLIFSGVGTDITTGTNEDLTLSPNGTGKLDVVGATELNGDVTINGGSLFAIGSNQGVVVDSGTNRRVGFIKYDGREAGIWRVSLQDFEIGRVTVPALPGSPDFAATNPKAFVTDFYIANNGFIGIGANNKSPSATLDVKGSTKLSAVTVGGSTLHVTAVGAPVNPERVGIGTTGPSAKLDVVGTTELNGDVTVVGNIAVTGTVDGVDISSLGGGGGGWTDDGSDVRLTTASDNVGIGAASPSAKLDVVGDTELNGAVTVSGNLTVDTSTFSVDSANNRAGIGTATPTEKMQMDGGFFYINGESGGFVIDALGYKRVGFMKYAGREAGVWRVPGQDYEIGRVTIADDPATPLVDESIILPGTPSSWTTDLYIDGDGDVGIGIGNGAGTGTNLARDLHISDVMRLEPRTSPPDRTLAR